MKRMSTKITSVGIALTLLCCAAGCELGPPEGAMGEDLSQEEFGELDPQGQSGGSLGQHEAELETGLWIPVSAVTLEPVVEPVPAGSTDIPEDTAETAEERAEKTERPPVAEGTDAAKAGFGPAKASHTNPHPWDGPVQPVMGSGTK
jgi:hypothetical protein